jgi:hypothetical protein
MLNMDDSMDSILDAACKQWEDELYLDEFDLSGDKFIQQLPSQFFNLEKKPEPELEEFDLEGDEIIGVMELEDDPFDSEGDEIVAAVETSFSLGHNVEHISLDNGSLSGMDLSCK